MANTLVSLALLQQNFNFLPVLFTISKPLITVAEGLGIPYYFGYQFDFVHCDYGIDTTSSSIPGWTASLPICIAMCLRTITASSTQIS